jgi:hypothetical protein
MPAASMGRRRIPASASALALLAVALLVAAPTARPSRAGHATPGAVAVWPAFGYDAAGSDDDPSSTGITAANLRQLTPTVVHLPGVVDSSPVYVRNALVDGTRHDVYVVDTSYGRTFAIDAASGAILWQFVPRGIANWEGSPIITTSSPVVDPSLGFVYSASPEGRVHKLSLATGREVGGRWPVLVTYDPTKEKVSSSLEVHGPYVLVALAGLSQKIGEPYPRVGHLVVIARNTGRIAYVFNTACSNRPTIIRPSTCAHFQNGIWARIPAPVDSEGNYLVATADGYWDGREDWGDSVLELSPALKPLQSYTPADQAQLSIDDLDLGSSAPAQLTPGIVMQAGKDGVLRLLDLRKLSGKRRTAGPFLGGELSTSAHAPGGGAVRPQPAVWHRAGAPPWVFVANDFGIEGLELELRPHPHLRLMWSDGRPGSSPVIAGGLLYAYNVDEGGLSIYDPTPETGTSLPNEPLITLSIPRGHWNSPVVADGRIALGDGNANSHATAGDLYIWSLPDAGHS